MKPLSIAIAALTAALALSACKNRKEEPVPGPKADLPASSSTTSPSSGGNPAGGAPQTKP